MVAQLIRYLGYSAEGSLRRSDRSEKQRLWMSTQSVHALDPRNRASRDGAALLLLTPEAPHHTQAPRPDNGREAEGELLPRGNHGVSYETRRSDPAASGYPG